MSWEEIVNGREQRLEMSPVNAVPALTSTYWGLHCRIMKGLVLITWKAEVLDITHSTHLHDALKHKSVPRVPSEIEPMCRL